MIKYFLIGLLLILSARVAYGKSNRISWEYNYTRLGIQNGLPSSETYQVYQDRSGLLWILTDRGVVRYDGFRFKIYTTESGLSDNVNFRIAEDPNGGLWFSGYNGKLSVYKNGNMHPYQFNDELYKVLRLNMSGNVSLHLHRDGSIIYSAVGRKTIAVSKTGKTTVLMNGSAIKGGYLLEYGDDLLIQRNLALNDSQKIYLIRKNKKVFLGKLHFNSIIRAKKHKHHYFVMVGSKAYMHDQRRFKLISGDQSVIGLDCDDQFLYIGLYKNGVKKYRFDPKTKKLVFIRHYLPSCSVSSTFCDRNGALWFTTLERGVYVLYDESFEQLFVNGSKLNDEIRFVNGNKNNIILTYYVGKWQQLYTPFLYKDEGRINSEYHMLPVNNGFVFCKGVVDWSDWKDVDDRYQIMPSYKTDTSILGNDHTTYELVEIGKRSVTRYDYKQLIGSRVVGSYIWFHFARKDKLFMLYTDGVFVLPVKNEKIQKKYQPVLLKRLDRLIYNRVWGLITYSSGEGIYEINEETNRVSPFAPHLKLGKQIIRVFFDEKDRLWLANKRGVFLLEKKEGKTTVRFFLNRDRLSSAEIMDMYSYDNVLYLATKFGVQRVTIPKVKEKRQKNSISMLSIHAFANNKELPQEAVYPAKTDLIKISLSNTNLDRRNNYRYRFGESETWNRSDKGEIILNNPANGVYVLEISCLDEFNHWTKPVKIGVFEVKQILFLRWYFILLYAFLVIILFYIILKLSIQSVNKKNYMLNRMMELEQMALSAQMNPHFIFNSLNSIHSFLLYEENENAEKYLLRFAKLIRQTLSNSRVAYITVEEEYETLKNYILLERMRFKDNFDFQIECDLKQLPLYPCVPPMLIQPYVENAIIHGLAKRTNGAKLWVKFYMEDDLLKVLIEDNGIGYAESKKNKRDTGHKSYGTQITEERLKSFQGNSRNPFTVSLSNLDDSDPEFPGTRVILVIPIPG